MAVSDIFNTVPVGTSVLQSRVLDASQLVVNPFSEFNADVITRADSNLQSSILTQAERFINQTLQNLNTRLQTEVLIEANRLINQTFQNLDLSQTGQVLTQTESFINNTLLDLNSAQQAEILVLAQTLADENFQNLSLTQQAEILVQIQVLINEALRNADLSSFDESLAELINLDLPRINTSPPQDVNNTDLSATPTPQSPVSGQSLVNDGQEQNEVATALTPLGQQASLATEAAVASLDSLEGVQERVPVDPIPYGIAVYEVAAQKNTSEDLLPLQKKVEPMVPIEHVRPLDEFLQRPQWRLRKENRRPEQVQQEIVVEESDIRKMIGQLNESQANSNLPLRLVLAKHDQDYALDIYDCSDSHQCQLVYDAPIPQSELPRLRENLEHQEGILINTRS